VQPAPAKINLYLHVTGRRGDGYHLLDSLVAFADVGDRVEAEPAPDLSLRVQGPFAAQVPAGPDNLVARAAAALQDRAGTAPGARITLTKNLPVASGLGGGSADAAAVLRSLIDLWGLDPDPDALKDLALGLGADVPMCLGSVPAFVGGIGEQLSPAPTLPPLWLVLANPLVPLSTPQVFARRHGPYSEPARFADTPRDARAVADILTQRRNDLTGAARALAPEVGQVLDALARAPDTLLARMTGSGATCFGLYGAAGHAESAAQTLAGDHPGWWVQAAALAPAAAPV